MSTSESHPDGGDLDRWDAVDVGGGVIVIYDKENHNAWMQSDLSIGNVGEDWR